MKRAQHTGRAWERKLNRALMAAFAVVLLAGILGQIIMMTRLTHQGRRLAELRQETYALSVQADNLNLSMSQYHNLQRIEARARQLGMEQPDESQLRVLNLPAVSGDLSAQSADSSAAEDLLD